MVIKEKNDDLMPLKNKGLYIDRDDPSKNSTLKKREIGGREGLDPSRYGDWEKDGRCIDF